MLHYIVVKPELISDVLASIFMYISRERDHPERDDDIITRTHGLRTPNEGINQRNLKILADVADKICFGRT